LMLYHNCKSSTSLVANRPSRRSRTGSCAYRWGVESVQDAGANGGAMLAPARTKGCGLKTVSFMRAVESGQRNVHSEKQRRVHAGRRGAHVGSGKRGRRWSQRRGQVVRPGLWPTSSQWLKLVDPVPKGPINPEPRTAIVTESLTQGLGRLLLLAAAASIGERCSARLLELIGTVIVVERGGVVLSSNQSPPVIS
jgi:hypothetical protein